MSAFGNAGNNLMNLFLVEHIRELQKTAAVTTMKNGRPFPGDRPYRLGSD